MTMTSHTVAAVGSATRLLVSGVGYLIIIFGVFGVLDLSMSHLLIGAGLAGVVLGIAAQQSLGNAFAAVVLLMARPFVVGDRIRVRFGALAGIFEATVLLGFKESSQHPDLIGVLWQDTDNRDSLDSESGNSGGR